MSKVLPVQTQTTETKTTAPDATSPAPWSEEDLKTVTAKQADGVPEKYRDLETKSAQIRAMSADGYKTGQIAKALGIRYQHARNVLKTPLKKTA